MSWVFGKAIETRRGSFAVGQPLPPEWDTRETRKQLVEKFGDDVLARGGGASNEAVVARLTAIEQSLEMIKEALGVDPGARQRQPDKAKGRA